MGHMKRKNLRPSAESDFLGEHLPYEIDMFRATMAIIASPSTIASSDEGTVTAIGNAVLEAFCLHARIIHEFLRYDESCDFDPRWFTNESYKLEGKDYIPGDLLRKLNTQIAH